MSMETPSAEITEEPEKSSALRSLESILDSSFHWGLPLSNYGRGSSWPECGAIPRDNSSVFPDSTFETPDDLTEDTVAVYHFDDEKGLEVLYRDRTDGGESLEDFKSRVAVVLGKTLHPQVLED